MDPVAFVAPATWGGDFVTPGFSKLINAQAEQVRAYPFTVPPCALAAIVDRETGGRNIFQAGVPRGPGCGVGYAQITSGVDWSSLDHPAYSLSGESYDLTVAADNLYIAVAAFLAPSIDAMLRVRSVVGFQKMPEEILFYAFMGYNYGWDGIRQKIIEGLDAQALDALTTNAYGAGTFARYEAALVASHAAESVNPTGGAEEIP